MKAVTARDFFVTEWALADERCASRMERMMEGFGVPVEQVRTLTEDEIKDVARERGWIGLDKRLGREPFMGAPDFVFSKFRWGDDEDRERLFERRPFLAHTRYHARTFLVALYGFGAYYHLENGKKKRARNVACWGLNDLHSAYGCFHKCLYCRRGAVESLMLNVEEFVEHVSDLVARNPWQKVFRYDVETDPLILEPEYGACAALVNDFAAMDDRYIILFSKSDNVDFLLDLDHKGHTIMLWTLSTPTVSRRIEVDTATTEQRIEAARKCQEAGYTVRFKCKPIIPISNWREEAEQTFEMLFASVQPDTISMEMLFFGSTQEWRELFDPSLFDPELYEMVEQHEAAGAMDTMHPFPDDFREEVYNHYADVIHRISPNTRLSLCAETPELWRRLGPRLGMTAESFACNCGPVAVPGVTADRITTTPDGCARLDDHAP